MRTIKIYGHESLTNKNVRNAIDRPSFYSLSCISNM